MRPRGAAAGGGMRRTARTHRWLAGPACGRGSDLPQDGAGRLPLKPPRCEPATLGMARAAAAGVVPFAP